MFLDTFIAYDKTWSSKVQVAIQSIRKLTYFEKEYNGLLTRNEIIEWPAMEDLTKMEHPHDFRLKSCSYFSPKSEALARVGINHNLRAGVQLETVNSCKSPLFKPDFIQNDDDYECIVSYELEKLLYATGSAKIR